MGTELWSSIPSLPQANMCIDAGTNALTQHRPATPQTSSDDAWRELERALTGFKAEATNFGYRFIEDAGVRSGYVAEAERAARELLEQVRAGAKSAQQAALEANTMRNALLDAARLRTSDIGRAGAEALKATGKTLTELETWYAAKLFKKAFSDLADAEKSEVWLAIVEASGRANGAVTARALRFGKIGRGLIVVSVAIAVYNVATAENKGRQVVKEGDIRCICRIVRRESRQIGVPRS